MGEGVRFTAVTGLEGGATEDVAAGDGVAICAGAGGGVEGADEVGGDALVPVGNGDGLAEAVGEAVTPVAVGGDDGGGEAGAEGGGALLVAVGSVGLAEGVGDEGAGGAVLMVCGAEFTGGLGVVPVGVGALVTVGLLDTALLDVGVGVWPAPGVEAVAPVGTVGVARPDVDGGAVFVVSDGLVEDGGMFAKLLVGAAVGVATVEAAAGLGGAVKFGGVVGVGATLVVSGAGLVGN